MITPLVFLGAITMVLAGCSSGGAAGNAPTAKAAGATSQAAVNPTDAGGGVKVPEPVKLDQGSQATCSNVAYKSGPINIAYMPPATSLNYYLGIKAGMDQRAKEVGNVNITMLAPTDQLDINGQQGMIRDELGKHPAGLIMNFHDQNAGAPLVKQAISMGIPVVLVNSDIPNFPTPIQAVVGYSQAAGQEALGQKAAKDAAGKTVAMGLVEGDPGYFEDVRLKGFKKGLGSSLNNNIKIVGEVDGHWAIDGGDTAALNLLQAHPNIKMIWAGNDNEAFGAAKAAAALHRNDILIYGNDGDPTAGLVPIENGQVRATLNTSPFDIGRIGLQVMLNCLHHVPSTGGLYLTPWNIVTKSNVLSVLCKPEQLVPQPAKKYSCS